MKTVKSIDIIQNELAEDKPLWICLHAGSVQQMAIGWIARLAKHSMIALPDKKDLKNHEKMLKAEKKEAAK